VCLYVLEDFLCAVGHGVRDRDEVIALLLDPF
jgi:hypothetical protein